MTFTTASAYRALLRVLPRSFREEFADEMTTVFLDQARRETGAGRLALLISAIGVYGVTAATTAARRRELAVRAAVGANRRDLLRLVTGQGMIAAAVGVAFGLAGGLAASTILETVLYEVEARDPFTFAAVGGGLLMVCWVATYLPARRALTASPAEALRSQ